MRQLHPVTFHEQFSASGIYVHEREGRPTGVTESWTIHRLPDQSHLTRVDHDARVSRLAISILLEALRDSAGSMQRFDIHLYRPTGITVREAKASYTVFERNIQISRQINDQPIRQEEIALPAKTVICPLMHIFTGLVILEVIRQGGVDIPVFIPDLVALDNDSVLSGMIVTHSASLMGIETVTLAGKAVSAQRYRFIGGRYDAQSAFWLDQQAMPLMIQNQYERVVLKNDSRSPDFRQ